MTQEEQKRAYCVQVGTGNRSTTPIPPSLEEGCAHPCDRGDGHPLVSVMSPSPSPSLGVPIFSVLLYFVYCISSSSSLSSFLYSFQTPTTMSCGGCGKPVGDTGPDSSHGFIALGRSWHKVWRGDEESRGEGTLYLYAV